MSNAGLPSLVSDLTSPIYQPLTASESATGVSTHFRAPAPSVRGHLSTLLPYTADADAVYDAKVRNKAVYLATEPRKAESAERRRKRLHSQTASAAKHAMTARERKRRCLTVLPRALDLPETAPRFAGGRKQQHASAETDASSLAVARAATSAPTAQTGLAAAPFGGLWPLHLLWRKYIAAAVGDDHLRSAASATASATALASAAPTGGAAGASAGASATAGFTATPAAAAALAAAATAASQGPAGAKLLRADLHGAYVHVLRSKSPALVGLQGLVAVETQEALRVAGADGRVRTIPKRGAVFGVPLTHLDPLAAPGARAPGARTLAAAAGADAAAAAVAAAATAALGGVAATEAVAALQAEASSGLWMLYGDHLCYRSTERAVRKFKGVNTIDIA